MAPNRKLTSDTLVGLFLLCGVGTILLMTFLIREDLFGRTITVRVAFESVSGLEAGAPVLISGVRGGRVASIDYNDNPRFTYPAQLEVYETMGDVPSAEIHRPILVKLVIKDEIPIYSNARIRLEQQGFIGDKRVQIDPGDGRNGTKLVSGDILAGAPVFDIEKVLVQARGIATEVQGAVRGIREIVTNDETIQSVRETIDNTNRTVQKVHDYLEANEEDIREAVATAREATGEIRSASERVNTLLADDGRASQLLAETEAAIADIRAQSSALAERAAATVDGLNEAVANVDARSAAITDSAVALMDEARASQAELLAQIDETRTHVDAILVKLRAGEGTAGRLLTDPQPFEDLKSAIDALNRALSGRPSGAMGTVAYEPPSRPRPGTATGDE